jgi:hypothetical protein
MPRAPERLGHLLNPTRREAKIRTHDTDIARICEAVPRCRNRTLPHLATQLCHDVCVVRIARHAQATPEDTLACAQLCVPTPAQMASICSLGAVRFGRQRRAFVHQGTRQSAGNCSIRTGGDVNADAGSLKINDRPIDLCQSLPCESGIDTRGG